MFQIPQVEVRLKDFSPLMRIRRILINLLQYSKSKESQNLKREKESPLIQITHLRM